MEQEVSSCLSCQIVRGERPVPGGMLIRGRYWALSHGNPCNVRGYLVLCALRHVEFIGDLQDHELSEMGVMLGKASAAIQQVTGAERVYSLSAAEVERHTHVHLIPRLPGMPNRASLFLKPFFDGMWGVDESAVLPSIEQLRPLLASLTYTPSSRTRLVDDFEPSSVAPRRT